MRKLIIIFSLLLLAPLAFAQSKTVDAEGHQWWQHAVFYELYPRSFADSNDNGIGDLKGIESKLDYLKQLGVDAIWISPCYPSPQVDFGYDISDYENIDPMYGTLADFDNLAGSAKKHDIRIIMDYVPNHTSDKHKWFQASQSSKTSPYRDWYIWRDGKGANLLPNNWQSEFGHSAWKFDPKTSQYYYHFFYAEQPDLNWRNPEVKKAMFDVTRWWYKRGVSGFRLDAVDTLYEDPQLTDNPVLEGKTRFGDPEMKNQYNTKLPEVHDALRELRQVADESNAVLIGETWTNDIAELNRYYGENNDEVQMPMDFLFTTVNKLSPADFRKQIASVESAKGWPVYVISNHDIRRSYNRYGDGKHNDAIAKVMAGLYLTLRGTPIMYYGEEIGMENNDPTRKEDVKDPQGITGWPKEKGRDGERTPMQWNSSTNAGFSQAKPWLPVPSSYKRHNVEVELQDPNSILQFYKSVLTLRHNSHALLDGKYVALNQDDPNVISYLRQYKDDTVLVAVNMSGSEQTVSFDLTVQGLAEPKAATLLTTMKTQPPTGPLAKITMEPFSVYIAKVVGGGAMQAAQKLRLN